jgi:hypothetical protein
MYNINSKKRKKIFKKNSSIFYALNALKLRMCANFLAAYLEKFLKEPVFKF